jgi:hypothetical protein
LRRVIAADSFVWIEENDDALARRRSSLLGRAMRLLSAVGRRPAELQPHEAIADANEPGWRRIACADRRSGWFWFAPSRATPLEAVVPRIVPLRPRWFGTSVRWGFDLAWDGGSMRIGLAPPDTSRHPRPPAELLELGRALHRSGFAAPRLPEHEEQRHSWHPRSRPR